MALELTGRLVKKLPLQEGNGKNGAWFKQDFIIETTEQFPKKVCIAAWGDKTDQINSLNIGDEIKVGVNIESREYNERWYTDLKAWTIASVGEAPANKKAVMYEAESFDKGILITPLDEEDTLPF